MLYRGRYDSIFDIRTHYRKRGYRRDDFRFPEGELPREMFLDVEFGGFARGLGMRLGRQQVVWGEADVFRSLDQVNPLRLDQNGLLGDDFADYREPLWIAKFLYDIGDLGPIGGAGVEFFYSPNGRPATDRIIVGEAFRITLADNNPLTGWRRRNRTPFDQVRHPWEVQRIGPGPTEAQDFADQGSVPGCADPPGCADFAYLASTTYPSADFAWGNSMAGIRLLGSTFGGIQFSLNYLFKRTELPGTSLVGTDLFDPMVAQDGSPNPRLDKVGAALVAAATPDTNGNGIPEGTEDLIRRCVWGHEPVYFVGSMHDTENMLTGCQTTAFWYPWTHIIGATGTYNDDAYTGMVFRVEESLSTKEPRNGVPPLAGPRAGDYPRTRDFATNGMRQTSVWRSMVGFDYLRALGLTAARKWPQPFRSLFGGDQWLLSGQFFDEYYAHADGQIGLLDSVTDRMHNFNPIFTMVATGFFVNQRLRPLFAFGYDVNDAFPTLWMQAEYNIGARWAVRLGDVLYMGSKMSEAFLYLNKYADRDTLFLRLTYFLI
jgi:hypothetical protein